LTYDGKIQRLGAEIVAALIAVSLSFSLHTIARANLWRGIED
jgi:hypothetical protein